ncbi:PREDICTED: nesprin-1 [Nicrophorus vespilloides]|uniref:Nesprin-1 n=1 Tax=Nicrophorus vespilloides TaxID=110193 RepID=A0ABM1M0H3_NICVS|nr:PREDICTED: nesprin-1 [Nicrophorus vespilloides]
MQKKTFVNWINSYLSKRVPPLRVDDLIEDLKDGTKLLALLEVLSGEKLPVERGRVLRRPHFLSNANTALQFLAGKRIKLVNINASDLVDGRPPVVLGLIWTIILYFQIEENSRALEYLAKYGSTSSLESAGTSSSATKDKWKQGARKTLLHWVANALPSDSGIQVKDFGASWRDGVAFLAIIDAIKANLINLAELKKETNRTRLETAFDVAENELGISRLLDPEDVDVPKPDERSIMTYVAQFLHKYPEPKSTGPDAIAAIQEEYNELHAWLMKKTQYLEHLQQTNSLPLDYNEYLAFRGDVDEKQLVFDRLRTMIESQSMISITKESWSDVSRLWNLLEQQMRYWLWLLDSRLPGDFRVVGEWLAKAEKLIYNDDIPTTMNEETASIISRKLEEHKAFFVDLPTIQAKFSQACEGPLAREVPSSQLNTMAQRLNDIGPKAAQRRVRLKFLEHKCCLIAFLQLTETKLRAWTAKYGRLEKVVQLLEQYRNFVSKNHIFQEFNKAFIDMQAVIEEYKRDGNIDKKESIEIDKFIRDIGDRWKNVSMELRCVQSMLEEVVAYWRRWDSLSVEFDEWLNKAEPALKLPEEERMEFFQDISVWRDKYQLLGDTVSFLIATCEDKIAMQLRDHYSNMTERWEKLYPHVNKYSHAGDILRNRKDFRAGVEMLSTWLRKAEKTLANQELGSTNRIQEHLNELQKLQSEVEGVETLFKNISKTFQMLIQDLGRDEVDTMMTTLKHEKEALVKVRALIPMQLHLFNQLLVQQQSLEAGQKEINQWLDEAEEHLRKLNLVGDKENLNKQLEKHKQFFTRTFYYKSMLDSKNKVLRNIVKSVDQSASLDVVETNSKMEQLNDRFEYVTKNASIWEQKLQEALRCWFNFSSSERVISDWLNKAEQLISERHIDSKQAVEMHKNFFERVNERWIHDLVQSAQDLCNSLPNEQHKPIIHSVEKLQSKWKEVLSFAPLHLMRLEFRLDESSFIYYIKKIEEEISFEQQAFNKQENVDTIIGRNKDFFYPEGVLLEARRCLENLKKISTTFAQYRPEDQTLLEAYSRAEQSWKTVNVKVESLKDQLDQVPEKWNKYYEKFNAMVTWMDQVDATLKNILNDVNNMEEFEREKAVFQNICKDADAKREDMKWLVQTLDALTSHCPESQAMLEQKKLEHLITRYKNLIPTLEITMVKTDVLSKCYTYRREVREVCILLKRVKEQSIEQPPPESLETITQLIRQQETAISQLDLQRPNIMCMLQRGKELSSDTNAPAFVKDEVKTLEIGWTEAFDETANSLRKLKSTQTLWSNYSHQKTEILELLAKADLDLKRLAPGQYNSSNLASELQAKQEMAIHLREMTEELLRRLRDLCSKLAEIAPADKKFELQQEVTTIERRLQTTLEQVQSRVIYLEDFNDKWNSFQKSISELQHWTVQSAPQLLSAAHEDNIAPEDRVAKTELLQKEIIHKIKLLDSLGSEAREWLPDNKENEEALKMKADMVALQEKVVAIKGNVESQAALVSKDLATWQQYQSNLNEIRPWVEKAEIKINMGTPKPATIEEAIRMQKENQQFATECGSNAGRLQGISSICEQIKTKTNASDEIDAMKSRFTIIQGATSQAATKLDKLINNWNDFDVNAKKLESWAIEGQKSLKTKVINLNTPDVDKLEQELSKLKAFNNEISEQQAKLISLTQHSDSVAHGLSPEGAVLVKNRVHDLKANINQLGDSVRAKINDVSDAILSRHEFQTKLEEFTSWVDKLNGNIAQIDEVKADKVDSTLITIHSLLQDYSDKKPTFSAIYEEIESITSKTQPQESDLLREEYSKLVENYIKIENNLKNKKAELEKWAELLRWCNETNQQLSHIKYQIESQKSHPEELKIISTDIETIITKLITWKQTATSIDSSPTITILDGTGNPTTAEKLVREIEVKVINFKTQLGEKLISLSELKKHWNKFDDLQKQVNNNLEAIEQTIVTIDSDIKKPTDLQAAVDKINALIESQSQASKAREELRKEGQLLMKQDTQNVTIIQNILSTIESSWDKLHGTMRDQKMKYSDILFAWNEFQEAKDKIESEIGKIEEVCNSIRTPADLIDANLNAEKAKKTLDSLKKTKSILDKMDSKGESIIKKSVGIDGMAPAIRNELQETHTRWSRVHDNVLKLVQTTESQAVIWKHIQDTKNKLYQWLNEQNNNLATAIEKPNELEAGQSKLMKYKEELPQYLSLKQNIPTKYKQLIQLSDSKDISNLDTLMQLLEDQFAEVKKNADKLESVISKFGEKENSIRASMKEVTNKISTIREDIIKCDDLSGDNSKVLERLIKLQKLKTELQNCEPEIIQIGTKIQDMKATYPSIAEGTLPKEQQNLKKRFDVVLQHTIKIENSLLVFLKKYHSDKYGALQRLIQSHKEKVQWCKPEPANDRYNLELKLNALIPIKDALNDCSVRKDELESSLKILESVETPESIKALHAEKENLLKDLQDLEDNYNRTKELLERNISLHQKYDKLSESVSNWLKNIENKVRAESTPQVDMSKVDDKIKEIQALQKTTSEHGAELEELTTLGEAMLKEVSESRIKQYVHHLNTRYQAVTKFLSNYLDKLRELNDYKKMYGDSIKEVENWLVEAETKVNSFKKFTASGSKPNKGTLEELKKFAVERERGQALLNTAVEYGEALFSGITPENRDTIRTELRNLRDKSEALIDQVNTIYKQVESILMQRHSFDDSLAQVKLWIDECSAKLSDSMELDATLPEKKDTLHKYRSMLHDVNLHKNLLQQLKDKIKDLSDSEADSKLDENLNNYNKLSDDVNGRVKLAENYVTNHEAYNQVLEKCRDWLSALTSEAALLVDETSSESADARLTIVENLLSQKDEGDKIISSCKKHLETVIKQTSPPGHPPLINGFEEQASNWQKFLSMCSDAKVKLNDIYSKYSQFEAIVDDLEIWLKQKEIQVKDQSLRSTEETKYAHLTKLRELEEEILTKNADFDNASELAQSFEIDTELSNKVSQLISRYHTVKNSVKDGINRYDGFHKEHKSFNEDYAQFLKWLSEKETELQDMSHIVGDLVVLQDRQQKIKEILEEKNQKIGIFDDLSDRGEKLYSHTSPDGREIIRQQLRNMRTIWDGFGDDVQTALNKLEQCLMQFADFTATQEQLTKWLKDVERAMQQHTELKTTLQEKRAQLQNHKIMHQEIMSHQQLVESVCDKAQQLVDQTQDKSLNIYLQSIKQLFQSIVDKSQDLLNNLEDCVDKHNQFNSSISAFKEWIASENEKLHELEDLSGEKSDILARLSTIKSLKDNESEGNKKLDAISQQLEGMVSSTAPKGIEICQEDIENLRKVLKQYLEDIDKVMEKQENSLTQWKEFENGLEDLNNWFKTTEVKFRDQPLQTTLSEKEAKLKNISIERDSVAAKEKEIDAFIDKSHTLVQSSGSQRIKPLISNITTRYQTLHTLSKDVMNRWQSLVDDHHKYQDKLEEVSTWLTPLEEHLATLQHAELADNIGATTNRLQVLLTEKDNGEHKVNSLTIMGERLFPDTAAQGREIIRTELRDIRSRWDKLDEGIKQQQHLVESQSLQINSYKDMLQQVLTWLDSMEKVVQTDPTSWTTVQEVRAKLLKHKTTLQEIITHKRIIEGITEKAQTLIQLSNNKEKIAEVEDNVKSINERYHNLHKNAQTIIKQLEDCLEVYQQFYDAHKAHQDYQKQLWDKLTSYSDYGGNKQMLEERLSKVMQIQDNLQDGKIKLKELEDQIKNRISILPVRAQDSMKKDYENLKFDLEKFGTSLNEVIANIEDRLKQWNDYESTLDRLVAWLADAEMILKTYGFRNTLEEKQEQLDRYQELSKATESRNQEVKNFVNLSDHLEQALILSLRQNEADFDKLADESTELVHSSGDTRISVNVQQVTSRFQSIQNTAREIVKKCEQAVADHKLFNEKYRQCSDWIAAAQARYDICQENIKTGGRKILAEQIKVLDELISQQNSANSLLNNTIELGEKLYKSTASEGRDVISNQLQELQQALEALYDGINSTDREIKAKLSRWSGFEECADNIKKWLKQAGNQLPQELELKATLDEKRAQLQIYRTLLHDATTHQEDIIDLRERVESLPEVNEKINNQLVSITNQHAKILKRAQNFVERYEVIVNDHQHFNKTLQDIHEWMENTSEFVSQWGDVDLERIVLISNLERLKNLQSTIQEEESRIANMRALGDKVIPGTVDHGQPAVRSEIDTCQQEWAALISKISTLIETLETKLQHWSEFEALKEKVMTWIRDTDTTLHSVDLKATANEKQAQLEILKGLQGEVRAKELEIDSVTEKAQQLNKGLGNRNSQISELGVKYQQVCHKVKDLTSRWQQYVNSHQDFNNKVQQCEHWLDDTKKKLNYCSDVSTASQKDLEKKMAILQDLIVFKEEGFGKIQNLVESAQTVLANTAPEGHADVNNTLANLSDQWSFLASKMIETKAILDDALTKWAGLLEQSKGLNKTIEWMQTQYDELIEFQSSIPEKKAQLDRIQNVEEKVRCDKIEVDNLKIKIGEMLASKQQGQSAVEAKEILDKFDDLASKIIKLLYEREHQFRDHKTYKEAYDEFQRWLTRAQEKVPQIKQKPIGDKLSVETFAGPLDALLNKQAQGEVLLDNLEHTAQVILPSTNKQGQESINNDNRALRECFERLFKDLREQRNKLEVVLLHWRDYKDEYERLSDWLQQIAILTKNQKIALSSNLEEKAKQVQDVKDILKKLDEGKKDIEKFNESSKKLLNSPLDIYVNNQLQSLNSRYQVELNLAKDVLKKVETNHEQHKQYNDNLEKSRDWIEKARELIRNCSESSSNSSKEVLQLRLEEIQKLLQKREEGQNLVHTTINSGEKVLRNTRSDGRERINGEIKELQADWEKLVKKMSTAKVHLETSLLQWADYDSSYSQLQQWITDREAKLQQVTEQKVVAKKGQSGLSSLPIGERKATLRETNSIVQDIVSFEPMIQSVTSKAEDLMQGAPASEISTKYQSLSKQAKELYEKQKETVEQHQAFVDAANDFVQWIRVSKERLSKCSEPTGDKESLASKLSQLKILLNELPAGQKKLEFALEQGETALQCAEEKDKEIIEEEIGLLQDDYDSYVECTTKSKNLLEVGIVKWTEYEEHYQDAMEWIAQTEELVQSYNKLQDSLEEKRMVLEQFQVQLQTLFDWQKELDRLNMRAQVLLETCADTRISNAVTQMSTKYNALLSLAKEVMRRLELHYQEHQQHSTLYQECQDWVFRTRDKLNECFEIPNSLNEVNNKLQIVKGIRTMLEQGQNKLRYILELKERVIMNTEQSGAVKIQEDTETLKQDMEKLLVDVNEARNRLQNRATQLEDIAKAHKILIDWLVEIETQTQAEDEFLNDLSEKKAHLEKFKNIQKEIGTHSELVDKLKSKLAEHTMLKTTEYDVSFKKYEDLKTLVSTTISNLEDQVKEHEKYKQSYQDAYEWIRKTRIEAQQCSDLHEELDKIKEKESKIAKIIESIPECDDLVHKTIELSISVMKTTGNEGKDNIKLEIEQLNNEWEALQYICKETGRCLNKCIEAWKEYTDFYNTMKIWIEENQALVDKEIEADKKTPEDLKKCKELLEKIVAGKLDMEQLNDYCECLMEQSASSWVRDQTVQLQGAYTSLLTSAQGLVSKVEKNLSDHTEFLNAKKELEQWLFDVHAVIQNCIGVGDEETLNENMNKIKQVAISIPEGQVLVTALQDAFAKAIDTTPADKQDALRDDMTTLRNSWDQLSMNVTTIQAQVKASLTRWEDYNESIKRFDAWLIEMEVSLKDKPPTRGELSEMKTLHERYKNMHTEIVNKQSDLDRLQSESVDLSKWANKPKVQEDVKKFQLRHAKILEDCERRKQELENEMQEYNIYHQSLQDTEKWILQVSFHLMSHNSLYITNREQTEEQIKQHDILVNDIKNYQSTLNDVKAKGQAQIDRYVASAPAIKNTIHQQLTNVQASYDSLLNTALQINKRLLETLAKFNEYEETLESIMKNLEVYEPIIEKEFDKPTENAAEAKTLLESAKNMHNKLQAEKSRLALAVQACEAATASISRPGTPGSFRDDGPAPIPQRELEVRAKLEDLIDQVQSHLGNLTSSVSDFEEKAKQRLALKDWILGQKAVVTDWKLRPSKLRADAAKQELANMNELLDSINQRRNHLTNELPGNTQENAELEKMLDNLERELCEVISQKQADQDVIDEYRQNIQTINNWFDNLIKRVDAVDKGSGLTCLQKQSALEELQAEFDDQGPKRVDEVKRLAALVLEFVNNLDSQQIEEQMKGVDRRYKDITKRLQRKAQVLETTRKGIDDTRNEIEQARLWCKERLSELNKPTSLGYESRKAEERLTSLKSLLKDADNKLVLKETLSKRVSNMMNEIEPSEQNQLEASLKNLGLEQVQLVEKIKSEMDRITAACNTRRNLEANLEKAKAWLKAKNNEIRKLSGYLPLKSHKVQQEIAQHNKYEKEIRQFNEGDLNDLLKLGNNVLKECDEEDRIRLQQLLDEVKEEYDTLQNESKNKIEALSDLLQGRKQFEEDINNCIDWLKEAEVATSAEIRAPNLEVLEEQLLKYDKLNEESRKVQEDIDKITEQAKAILPTISESDKLELNETLTNMKDRHKRIADLIMDRTNALKQNINQQKEAANRIAESVQFMQDIQNELKELSKPIGSKVDDVHHILSTYERILKDLKANKAKLSDVPGANKAELQGIISMQDDLIKSIEDQIARLRQLLLLREQFIALITEIMTFITKYTEIVRDIEKSGTTIEEKIERYDDVIIKIQECEAMLASAADKGQQIAADGSAQDRNSITEQIQSLKQSLTNLRRAVEKQKQIHENTAAEYRKLAAELEEILDWLHANETTVQSRPLLKRDLKSVESELNKHRELAEEVNKYLDRVRQVQEATKHDSCVPSSLQEQLSEAKSLLASLPRELEEREKYLLSNKALREHYEELKQKLNDWVKEAEIRMQGDKDGIDFENILSDLEEHKIFFSTENSMKELVSQTIQQSADKIWPSLTPNEQEELSREQQQCTQLLKNTLNLAKSQKARLEQVAESWKDYCGTLDKVKAVVARSQFTDEPVSALAGLHFNIQKIEHVLNDINNQQGELDLLRERASEILQHADERNRKTIEQQLSDVTGEWTKLVSTLESRKDIMNKLAGVWETFEGRCQHFESLLTGIEERSKHVDTVVRNKQHVITTYKSIEELLSEANSLKPLLEEILQQSSPVLLYLEECSKTSAKALSEHLKNLGGHHQRLLENLNEKRNKTSQDLEAIGDALDRIASSKDQLKRLQVEVRDFYVWNENVEQTESRLKDLRGHVESSVQKAKDLLTGIRNKYLEEQQLVPTDLSQEITNLELLAEALSNDMDEKDREFKKARTVRSDYLRDVDGVQSWIKEAELKVRDRSIEPHVLNEHLQQIQSEIGSITDRLEKLIKNGKVIMEKTKDEDEKALVQSTINNLTEQLHQVNSWLEEKKQQISETIDAWQRFLALHQTVMAWVQDKKVFLKEPLQLTTLQEAKQKLHDYSNAVKSCKPAAKNLSEMAKELEYIGAVTNVGDLPQKMEEAEEAKAEVEMQILERNASLQETSEEWEQCERKMKDVRTWIEKTKHSLESQQNKKKPLRDQHAVREKMLADIHNQKLKIELSVEKLQLHFRSGIGGDSKVTDAAKDLIRELDVLQGGIKDQCVQLETSIAQVDQYQSEVQKLRQQIVKVEQQLRAVMAPTHLPHDRDQAARDQQACRDRVRALQSKMMARNERIKLIMQRGTPDSEPLDT